MNDSSVETVPEGSVEYNFVEVPSYTWKSCEKGFEDDQVTCGSVNFAIKRNFQTLDDEG